MTTILTFPGVTVITPKGKARDDLLHSFVDSMAEVIVRSGLSVDDHDALTLLLHDRGYPVGMIAHLMPQAVDLARRALAIAKSLDATISDRRSLQ